jgi:cell division protein FtsQ
MARIARTSIPPAAAMADAALPPDVRWMSAAARLLYLLAAGVLGAAALAALWRGPWFPLRSIQIDGDLLHNDADSLRAQAARGLAGNFFSLDLARARAAFEAVPWVRSAEVRKVWPDRLAVHLQEHRAAAVWEAEAAGPVAEAEAADRGSDTLVDLQGELFAVRGDDVPDEALPTFTGPPGSAARMLALYRRLAPVFEGAAMTIDTLSLSGRDAWRLEIVRGATVELGRGSDDELVARSQRFIRTLPEVLARYGRPLVHADLRHAEAYAVRLQGVTTPVPAPGAKTD